MRFSFSRHQEQRRLAYWIAPFSWWSRVLLGGCALLSGTLLYQWGGGFPPLVWSEAYTIFNSRSAPIAMAPVIYQSLIFLLGWMLLLLIALHILRPFPADEISTQGFQRLMRKVAAPKWEREAITRVDTPIPMSSLHVTGMAAHSGLLTLLTATSSETTALIPFTLGKAPPGLVKSRPSREKALTGVMICESGHGIEQDRCGDATQVVCGFCALETSPAKLTAFSLLVMADSVPTEATTQSLALLCTQMVSQAALSILMSGNPLDARAIPELLKQSIQPANELLSAYNQRDELHCAVDLTVVLILDQTLYTAFVGRNRCYIYRDEVGLAHITKQDAFERASQRMGTLGRESSIEIESRRIHVQPGDLIFLCSDGLWLPLRSMEIQRLVKQANTDPRTTPEQLGLALCKAARAQGGMDHQSLVVARVDSNR